MVKSSIKLIIFCLLALATQVPIVSALSDAQRQVLDQGIYYFNTDSSGGVCSESAAPSGSSSGSSDLKAIVQKYSLQSAIIEKVGGSVVDSYQADQPPNTPASTMKLIIADTLLRLGTDLTKTVSVGSDVYYDHRNDMSPPSSTATLQNALEQMLSSSSNVAANVLMKEIGGTSNQTKNVDIFTQKAQSYGYAHTVVKGYYDPSNDGKNTSTIGDEVAAMNHIFISSSGGYSTAQGALQQAAKTPSENPYGVTDDANKWAGTQRVAGNVGKLNIAGQDYIIGLYINKPPATDSSAKSTIKNGTADIANLVAAQNSGPNGGNNGVPTAQVNNTDYAGRPILNQGELKALDTNTPTYQQASTQVGIPWQTLAALHYREHDFSLSEPDNGQGVYQIVDSSKHSPGGYPPAGAQLTADQFLIQSVDAANFIKKDGAGLGAQSPTPTIKDALVKYNGEPQKYIDQAQALGYSSQQGYEGSPYVMNIANTPRDPTNGPLSTWLQDRGNGNFQPATADQYGAYVVYSSISGLGSGGSCGTSTCNGSNIPQDLSTIRQNVVCLAQQELVKWDSGQLKPGTGYLTYSQNTPEDWCADFVSWIYDQAKYPLGADPNWRVSGVENLKSLGQQEQNFHWHPASGYTPKAGDIAIHNDGKSNYHANIVIGVSGN